MKNLLITGGTGYLGSRIVEFLKDKYNIVLLTRKNNFIKSNSEKINNFNINIIEGFIDWDHIYDDYFKNIDVILHLASPNEIDCNNDPIKAINDNIINTYKLIDKAIRNNVKRFIYYSTIHIYGTPLKGYISENTIPRPIHPYAITKKSAEDIVLSKNDKKEIESIVLRLSNGFGYPVSKESARWKLIVNDLCRTAIEKGQIILKTKGNQCKNFITFTDICLATEHFINLESDKLDNSIFNIGGSKNYSILEIASFVKQNYKELFNKDIDIIIGEEEENNFEYIFVIDKLIKTGFKLTEPFNYEIRQTLLNCYEWFNKGETKI